MITTTIDKFIVLFFFYSFCGWIWETIYCSVREGHFQSRGFLFGPICPIYGVAIASGQIVYEHTTFLDPPNISIIQIFFISMIGSAILEYTTSLYLEKRFHIRWWDYSDMPLNVNGRICLPASVFFGVCGVFVVRYLLPYIKDIPSDNISPLFWEISSLVLVSIASADFALTEASLSSITQHIVEMQQQFIDRAEKAYQTMRKIPANAKYMLDAGKIELSESFKLHSDWRHKNILWRIKKIEIVKSKDDKD